MNNMKQKITLLSILLVFWSLSSFAATFNSTQTGNWNDAATWLEGSIPTANDEVHINDGHIVTMTGNTAYTHNANLTIHAGGELIANVGNSNNGLIFNGGIFHVFGNLTLPFPDRDLEITGTSLFWGHPSAIIFISDDWKISGNSETIVDGICVEVDDDFHIEGANTSLCGGGGVSIGAATNSNTFNLKNGASLDQVCTSTIVYRGVGGNCTTLISKGTGNQEPIANPDMSSTTVDEPITIDVLDLGTPDNDPDNEALTIIAAGQGTLNTETTDEGGTVTINNNGTPNDPSDDYIDYTPPAGFVGIDYFQYVITDESGSYQYTTVTVEVTAILPVELANFRASEGACKIALEWATETEINSKSFEVERSTDGVRFSKIGTIAAAGFSTAYRIYDFEDELPSGNNYYRLKMIDRDGTTEYSRVIFVESDCIENGENIGIVSMFPNPVMGENLNLRFNANQKEEVFMIVSDLYGKTLRAEPIVIEKGMNNLLLDITAYQAGTYVVTLGQKTEKFIKVKD